MKNKLLTALVVAILSASAVADQSIDAKIKAKLEERLPGIKVQSVGLLPSWPGVYEVVTSDEVIYADASGDHLIIGNMMETATRTNLTQERWSEVNKVDFSRLPIDKAIKIVKGNGKRKLAIFEDPYCPYCQQLEHTLNDIDDVTLFVFLYPLEDLHPGASKAAQAIWCANDRSEAWLKWMQSRQMPNATACAQTPINQLAELGASLKINSTPTLIFSDGHRVPGAISAEKITEYLSAASK